jgi:hypothetical protein
MNVNLVIDISSEFGDKNEIRGYFFAYVSIS